MKRDRLCIFYLLFLISYFFHPFPLYGEKEAITIEMAAGFNGVFEAETWVPFIFFIETKNEPFLAEMKISIPYGSIYNNETAEYSIIQTFYLSPGSRERIKTVLPVQRAGRISVEIKREGVVLYKREFPLYPRNPGGKKILVLSRNPSLDFIHGLNHSSGEALSALYAHPEFLPETPIGYSGLDTVVLHNVNLINLSAVQIKALTEWIRQGGFFIITGGAHLRDGSLNFLDSLSPVSVTGHRYSTGSLALEGYTGFQLPEGSSLGVTLSIPKGDSRIILADSGYPLIIEKTLGIGKVLFCAVDYAPPPIRDWPGKNILWREILNRMPERSASPPVKNPFPGLGDSPAFSPQGKGLKFFLTAYPIIILSAILLVLSAVLKKRPLIFYSLALVLPLLTGIVYFISPLGKSPPQYLETALIYKNTETGKAAVYGTGSFMTKDPVSAIVSVPAEIKTLIPREGDSIQINEGPASRGLVLDMPSWSGRRNSFYASLDIPLEYKISLENNKLICTILNNSSYSLCDGIFIYRGSPIGFWQDLPQRDSLNISFSYNPGRANTPGDRWSDLIPLLPPEKRMLLETILYAETLSLPSRTNSLFFLAWPDPCPRFLEPAYSTAYYQAVVLAEIPFPAETGEQR